MLNKLTLTVGLVTIPVSIENATNSGTKPSGKYVCSTSALPTKSIGGGGHQVCDGKHEGACSRAVGYPKADGTFFIPSDDELEAMKAEKAHICSADTFVPIGDVDPVYFNSTYVVRPEKGAEEAFWLLARRLAKLDRIAVGSAVLDKDEVMLFLRWSHRFECLFLEIGIFDEQIRLASIMGAQATEPDVTYSTAMIKLADDLIKNTFEEPFDPKAFVPKRWHALRNLILANGASPDGDAVPSESPEPTVDLMAQLKATVAKKNKATAKKVAAERPKRKVA